MNKILNYKWRIQKEILRPNAKLAEDEKALKAEVEASEYDYAQLKKVAKADMDGKSYDLKCKVEHLLKYLEA